MCDERFLHAGSPIGVVSSPRLVVALGCGAASLNTLIESVVDSTAPSRNRFAALTKGAEIATLGDIEATGMARTPTGLEELDRVLGGGMVDGGVVLIGGDPDIGKSTLLLQALDALQRSGQKTPYVTGEERRKKKALRKSRCVRAVRAWTTRGSWCWPKSSWRRFSPRSTLRGPTLR